MAILTPKIVYRKWNVDGVPESGKHDPEKAEIIQMIEGIQQSGSAGILVRPTKAALDVITPDEFTAGAWVLDDANPALNGYYYWTGFVWLKGRSFPDTFAEFVDLAGTNNAVTAGVQAGVNPADIAVFFIEPLLSNTGAVTLNGLPVRNVNGDALAPGEWPAGRMILLVNRTTEYRLLSDPDVDGVAAAAAASASAAEGFKDDAEAAAIDAHSAVVFNRVAVKFTTVAAGPYNMGTGNTIGSVNNLDVKIGGVLQDHDTYSIAGTTFTLTTNPGAGLAMEAVLSSNSRVLEMPADASVSESSLDPAVVAKLNRVDIVTAEQFGAVFDDTAPDRAKIKQAALYAIANKIPFRVPNRGGVAGTGIEIQVPEDVANLQEAINAVASWEFPRNLPVQTTPYAAPYLVTISVVDDVIVSSGKGYVWPLPKGGSGDLVLLKGRNRQSLTFDSYVGQTAVSGIIFVTLQFTALPAGIAASEYLSILLTTGAGEHHLIRGCWQISAVDTVNKRLTFKVNAKGNAFIASLGITTITAWYIPTILQFTNMPFDGADRAGIDVQEECRLNIQDIVLSGDAGGTNAVSTEGIMVRYGGRLNFEQYVGIYGFQRAGIWLVEDGAARVSFGAISYCDTGINVISGSVCIADYAVFTGCLSHNIVVGIASSMSGAPLTSGGSPGNGVYALNGGVLITSLAAGYSRITTCGHGVVAETGGIVHLNDMPVVGCAVGAAARPGSCIFTNGVFTANTADYKPALNTPSMGAIVSNNYAVDL